MKPAFDLDLEPFDPPHDLIDPLIKYLSQLVLFSPYGLSDLLYVLRMSIVLLRH